VAAGAGVAVEAVEAVLGVAADAAVSTFAA